MFVIASAKMCQHDLTDMDLVRSGEVYYQHCDSGVFSDGTTYRASVCVDDKIWVPPLSACSGKVFQEKCNIYLYRSIAEKNKRSSEH